MLIRFDILKVTQAAAFVLAKHGGVITRRRLLKVLYIADRELIATTRRPLTGDRPVAMDHGPVLSHTYDLLKGAATGIETWSKYIGQVGPFTHRLLADPGVGLLTKLELGKLDDLVQRYWCTDDDALSDLTHEFAEWKQNEPPRGGARPIPTEHVLSSLGLAGEADRLHADAAADAELDALLNGAVT